MSLLHLKYLWENTRRTNTLGGKLSVTKNKKKTELLCNVL